MELGDTIRRRERGDRLNTLSKSKVDRFYGFTSSIINKTKESYAKNGGTVEDVMSITAMELFSSPSLQENIGLGNEIQKEVGSIQSYSGRKSVAELRAQKRIKREGVLLSFGHIFLLP